MIGDALLHLRHQGDDVARGGGTVVHGFTPDSAVQRLLRRGVRADLTASLLNNIRGSRAEGEYERFLQRVMRMWAGHPESELADLPPLTSTRPAASV